MFVGDRFCKLFKRDKSGFTDFGGILAYMFDWFGLMLFLLFIGTTGLCCSRFIIKKS
jgi:hypothetical protein